MMCRYSRIKVLLVTIKLCYILCTSAHLKYLCWWWYFPWFTFPLFLSFGLTLFFVLFCFVSLIFFEMLWSLNIVWFGVFFGVFFFELTSYFLLLVMTCFVVLFFNSVCCIWFLVLLTLLWFLSVLRIRIRDPGSGIWCLFDLWIREPGWVKIRIRIQDEQPESYFREL